MSNQVILIGRLVNDPTLDNDTKTCEITLAVVRDFKNELGIYESDFIPVTLSGKIATNVVDLVYKGDMVAIRGKVARLNAPMRIIADQVTFLSSKRQLDS